MWRELLIIAVPSAWSMTMSLEFSANGKQVHDALV